MKFLHKEIGKKWIKLVDELKREGNIEEYNRAESEQKITNARLERIVNKSRKM